MIQEVRMRSHVLMAALGCVALATTLSAQDMPADYQQVLSTLGRQGDFKAGVLKVNVPRSDLSVTVAGVKTPTPFGFGGWVAFTKGANAEDVMMGSLGRPQDAGNPGMFALLAHGSDATPLR